MMSEDKVNILVVDDLPEKQLEMQVMLEELGENIVTAPSGGHALRCLLDRDFAVILLDVNLPGMDGFDTAALIRRRRKTLHTPIIFLTACSADIHTARGYSLGGVDYILAPVVQDVLRTKVKVFVDLFRMTEQVKREAEERLALERAQVDRAVAEEATRRNAIALDNARLYRNIQEGDRLKNEFLAMLAHELRNPLAPIRNAVQILKRDKVGRVEQDLARDIIDRQTEQLVRLVDDLLDVSRITRGKISLQKEDLDLAAVAGRAVETSRPIIESRKQKLSVELPKRPIRVRGDATRLAQVLSNLLNNAAKFTPEGGAIRLTLEQRDADAVARVRDTGVGIPREMLACVFDLFVQADRTLDRSQGGLGIGLTLVRRLVEMHGGSVQAFSAGPNQGSEFVVRLPVLTEAAPAAATDNGNGLSQRGVSGRRVLVVDDNIDSAETLAVVLRQCGHEVQTAHDGPSALEVAIAYHPQIVLLDIGLPGMDGYEVARQLRLRPGMENICLAAVTGYGREDDRRRSQAAGFQYHFIKPVDLDTLQDALARKD